MQIVSKTGYDTAHRDLSSAQQALAALNEQLAGIAANLNGHPTGPVEQYPQYLSALAARDEAARELAHTVVRAPFDGIVTSVPSIQPGRYLAASITAFYLVDTEHVWVHADPKETQLTYVRPGQAVTVTVDTYPDRDLAWHRREHQPRSRAAVLVAAGAEHERQLGEGRAAHPGACGRRRDRP